MSFDTIVLSTQNVMTFKQICARKLERYKLVYFPAVRRINSIWRDGDVNH